MAEQLDMSLLNELRDLMDGEFSVLLDVYIRESERQFHEANEAWEAGDMDRLGRSAHSLKGASCNIGAVQLADYCSELESAAKQRLETRVPEMLNRVTLELREVRDAVYAVRLSC